jgi:flagellar motor switch/type III secretory pathway protein FliN
VNPSSAVRPFPWRSLPSTTRAAAAAAHDLRRWARAHVDAGRLVATLGELVHAPLRVTLRRIEPARAAGPLHGGAGVAFAVAEAPHLARSALVEVDGALLGAVVARALQRPPAQVVDPAAVVTPGAAGALAAVLLAGLRRAHEGSAFRVLAAGPAAALEFDVVAHAGEALAATLTVLVADEAYEARVVVPRTALLARTDARWDAGTLASLGGTPLSVPVVAHAVVLAAADLAALAPGDALLLPGWPLEREGGALRGPVVLAAPGADAGISAQLAPDGRIVLRGEQAILRAPEAEMNEVTEQGGVVDTVGEVPVVVRVEIGEASMTAREWAQLGTGDVVVLGRRVGEPVTVRVGGVAVARGDLVEVDGEVGVRIAERVSSSGAAR